MISHSRGPTPASCILRPFGRIDLLAIQMPSWTVQDRSVNSLMANELTAAAFRGAMRVERLDRE
jgi:hypothetical protein